MLSSSHKSQALYLLVAVTALGAAAAGIPAPPWAARGTGPTSKLEVVTYAAQVRLLLPEDIRAKLDAASNAPPVEIAALLYEARLGIAVAKPLRGLEKKPSTDRVSSTVVAPITTASSEADLPGLLDKVTNVADRVAALKRMYGDQWQSLNIGVGAYAVPSVAAIVAGQRDFEDIERRIGAAADPLFGLTRYTNAFLVEGAAMSLFWHAQQLYWNGVNDRAEPLMRFLVRPENTCGFVVGGAHFHLGAMLDDRPGESSNAFVHYMMVHKYPACLVYTAQAYIGAASILLDSGMPTVYAEALLAIDVPAAGFARIRSDRHFTMAQLCRNRCDYIGMVRHLQVSLMSDDRWREESKRMIAMNLPGEMAGLWNQQMTNGWGVSDTQALIVSALESPIKTPNDELYLDALAHEWPTIEDVPAVVLTNRLLSNNVFESRRTREALKKTNNNQQPQ